MGWGDDFDTAVSTGRAILLGAVSVAARFLQVVVRNKVRVGIRVGFRLGVRV